MCYKISKHMLSLILVTCHQNRSSRPDVLLRKGFRKYAANLQENTHAEVQFQ